jgi:hypothetical protein
LIAPSLYYYIVIIYSWANSQQDIDQSSADFHFYFVFLVSYLCCTNALGT